MRETAANRDALRGWAARLLLELSAPGERVLDVGCGRGELGAALQAAGRPVSGVEPDAARAAAAAVAGVQLAPSIADAGEVDWVLFRHSLHHLLEPAADLRDAWAAARRGVLVVEPWFAERLASQRFGLEAERLLRALDRQRGAHHADSHPPEAVARWLPQASISLRASYPLRPWPLAELAAAIAHARGGARLKPEQRRQAGSLLDATARSDVTLCGSQALIARRGE